MRLTEEQLSLPKYELLNKHFQIHVVKLGGDNASKVDENIGRAKSDLEAGRQLVFIISAIRSNEPEYNQYRHEKTIKIGEDGKPEDGFNTTSHLNLLAENIHDSAFAIDIIGRLRAFYTDILKKECKGFFDEAMQAVEVRLSELEKLVRGTKKNDVVEQVGDDYFLVKKVKTDEVKESISLTQYGERMAEGIYREGFKHHDMEAGHFDSEPFHKELFKKGSPHEVGQSLETDELMRGDLRAYMLSQISSVTGLTFTGGYISGIATKRGYSDLTAAAFDGFLRNDIASDKHIASCIEKPFSICSRNPAVLKKIYGPKWIDHVRVVENINPSFSRELVGERSGAGSGVVLPEALEMYLKNDAHLFVYNPKHPRHMSHIHDGMGYDPAGADAVGMQRGVVVRIKAALDVMAGPITGKIAQWFEDEGVSYAHTGSAEPELAYFLREKKSNVAVFTKNMARRFEAFLNQELGGGCEVDLNPNRAMLHIMGNRMDPYLVGSQVNMALLNAGVSPDKPMSSSASPHGDNVVIRDSDAEKAVDAVHTMIGVDPDEYRKKIEVFERSLFS